MTVQPNSPTTPAVTSARPVVVLRRITANFAEVDLDARRGTRSFHDALARVARVLAPVHPTWRDDAPSTWHDPDEHGDRIDPRGGAGRRCRHRVHIDVQLASHARDLLTQAGYVVDVLGASKTQTARPRDPEAPVKDADTGTGVGVGGTGDVDPFARCDAPMARRYRDDAGASCDQRAYVTTAHRPGATGAGTLSWCGHHFREVAEPTRPVVIADSRRLLETPYGG